jgi:predicted nuclease of predicted toxin-antitoxin system
MAWKPLASTKEWESYLRRARRTRFLVDESVDGEVAEYLRSKKYNARHVREIGLGGRSDEDVLAYAWKHSRMLVTHDTDFLNERIYPEYKNPGVLIIPGGSGDYMTMARALGRAIALVGRSPEPGLFSSDRR